MKKEDVELRTWDRRRYEGAKPYEAFILYREMGLKRSLAKVAKALGKSKALMDRWSSKWCWVNRAADWDAHQDRVKQDEYDEQTRTMARRHAKLALAMLDKVRIKLKALKGKGVTVPQIIKMLDVATRVEREARGFPQKFALTDPSGKKLESITDEERLARVIAILTNAESRSPDDEKK